MGVVRKQDDALMVKQLLVVCEIAENDWNRSKSEEEKKEIESVILFMIIVFLHFAERRGGDAHSD